MILSSEASKENQSSATKVYDDVKTKAENLSLILQMLAEHLLYYKTVLGRKKHTL